MKNMSLVRRLGLLTAVVAALFVWMTPNPGYAAEKLKLSMAAISCNYGIFFTAWDKVSVGSLSGSVRS